MITFGSFLPSLWSSTTTVYSGLRSRRCYEITVRRSSSTTHAVTSRPRALPCSPARSILPWNAPCFPSAPPAISAPSPCPGALHSEIRFSQGLLLAFLALPNQLLRFGAPFDRFALFFFLKYPTRSSTARTINGSATVASSKTSANRPPSSGGTNFPHETASVYVLPLSPPQ